VTTLNETEVKWTWPARARWLTVPYFQVDALEHDALQVLSLVRSIKNTFALVNRTPPEVLTLVPKYLDGERLIKLTHVCRSWREVFISRPSLWTSLDCTNVDKTRVYIDRSKSSPLKISLGQSYREEAFLRAVPHIPRLKTLSISGNPTKILPVLVEHFSCPVPLLDELKISFLCDQAPTLPDELFNRDLSSLRELSLAGGITPLPWRDLSNLTTFNLCRVPEDKILLTQLLDFFESAPHLRHIQLHDSIPESSNAPAERVVPLSHLKDLSIIARPAHSILLNHLSIPAGASLRLEFPFSGQVSPTSSYLPKSIDSLHNICHITALNLCLGPERRFMRLHGPSGELYMLGNWLRGHEHPQTGTYRFIRSLDQFDVSRTRSLAITLGDYRPPEQADIRRWYIYRKLCRMGDLRTLMLAQCRNIPFINLLDPDKNPGKIMLCPKLEEIIIYIDHPDELHIDKLMNMAERRASRGAKLSAITIINTGALAPTKKVFQLRKHVSRVEYKFDDALPEWDAIPS
jgi:hypothetical protein